MTVLPTAKDLLNAACHFGHRTNIWNPKIAPYLYGIAKGIHIFDLVQTCAHLERVIRSIQKLTAEGKTILFVSTKQQAIPAIEDIGLALGQPIVTKKWIPGCLTNWNTVRKCLRYFHDLQESFRTGEVEKYTKKEQVALRKKLLKLDNALGGMKTMTALPDAVFIVDAVHDSVALREANTIKIPVFGICDSNADPDAFTEFIPANDDATASITLLLATVKNAALESRKEPQKTPERVPHVSVHTRESPASA